MMTLEEFAKKAVMVPFEEFGRSWDGWDCWGVVYLCFKEVCGVELPHYSGQYKSARRRQELQDLIRHRAQAEWTEVDKVKALDGVMLTMMGRSCHIGLMLDATNVLHVEENCMTMVEDITRPPWRGVGYDKVEGIYRHASQL